MAATIQGRQETGVLCGESEGIPVENPELTELEAHNRLFPAKHEL